MAGAETYVSVCATCHGSRGEGNIGPALNNTILDAGALTEVISKGKTGKITAMPAWSQEQGGPLKKHQIKDLVDFISNWHNEFLEDAERKHTVTAAAPLSQEKAQTARGKDLYMASGCSVCHGSSGGGTSFAPKVTGVSSDAIIKQVRTPRTSAMPSFSSAKLSDEELNAIVVFIDSLK